MRNSGVKKISSTADHQYVADRRARTPVADQLRPLIPLGVVWLVALVMLLALVSQNVIPYRELLLDPSYASGVPWYTGLVSNLGILAWTTATVAAASGAWVAWLGGRKGAAAMLRGGAVLSLLLLLDDLFQFHSVIPNRLGVPKASFYVMYLVLTWWWVVSERSELRRTNNKMLIAAGAAFAASIMVDQVGVGSKDVSLVLEDAAKFLGVLAWAMYFVTTARDITRSIVTELRLKAARAESEASSLRNPAEWHA